MKGGGPGKASALDRLSECCRVITGRGLGDRARERFERYLELLVLWNRTHNLTGFRTPEQIVRGLFEDSLLFVPLLPVDARIVLDIGAGAGVPGLPLAIVSEKLRVVMVEARRKRVSFLRAVCRDLELGGRVWAEEGRAEVIAPELLARFGPFDAALARAVSSTEAIAGIALPLLRGGGLVICSGPPAGEFGGSHANHRIVEYPKLGQRRTFSIVERSC